MNYANLERFWEVQSERIETRAKLNGLQWIIIIILTIVASFYITPIGGGFVAYASYRIILHWVVAANKALNTGGEYVTISKEAGKDVTWLLTNSLEEIKVMGDSFLEKAGDARDVITKVLKKRQSDLFELEKLDPNNPKLEDTKKKYAMCFEELDQINGILDPLLDEQSQHAQKNLKRQEDNEKQQAKVNHDKKVEFKQQLEALEKAYNVGILSKSEYDSKKSSINSRMKDI